MAEPLKHALGKPAIRCIADNVASVMPDFRRRAFTAGAARGLEALELKERVSHIGGALRAVLPEDALEAVDVLVRAAESWSAKDQYGFAGWVVIELVGELGRPHPREGLEALRRTTHLFSAEFAIRGFLEDDLGRTLKTLSKWTKDPSHYVRRLVSEGTRPRLPWGLRVRPLIEDPEPGLALLDKLKDDASETVRRSVANHLNDVAKDHPEVVTATCRRWSKGATDERRALIKHALRTLVKKGDPAALEILGFDPKAKIAIVDFAVSPEAIRLGESLEISFSIRSKARRAQPLVVDYAVHHVKKSGERTAKTFKLKTITLAAGESVSIRKRHTIKAISTRRYHSGRHAVELLVNGRSRGTVEFDLDATERRR